MHYFWTLFDCGVTAVLVLALQAPDIPEYPTLRPSQEKYKLNEPVVITALTGKAAPSDDFELVFVWDVPQTVRYRVCLTENDSGGQKLYLRNEIHVWAEAGTYDVGCTMIVMDYATRTHSIQRMACRFSVGPGPPPDPPPDIPDDGFGNLRRNVVQWSQELLFGQLTPAQIREAGRGFVSISNRMGPAAEPRIISADAAVEEMKTIGQGLGDAWLQFERRYQQVFRQHQDTMTRETLRDFLRTIGDGLILSLDHLSKEISDGESHPRVFGSGRISSGRCRYRN